MVPVDQPLPADGLLPVYIAGQPYTCLVDTGSTLSLISSRVYDTITQTLTLPMEASAITSVMVANGTHIQVRGKTIIPIQVGQKTYTVALQVLQGLDYELILGRDFFKKFGCVINYDTGRLLITGNPTLHLNSDINIPAHSQVLASARIRECADGLVGICKSADNIQNNSPVSITSSLVVVDKRRVPVCLQNRSSKAITIPAGRKLGLLETLDTSSQVLTDHSTTSNTPMLAATTISMDPADFDIDLSTSALNAEQKEELKQLLNKYRDVFVGKDGVLGRTNQVEHEIHLEPGTRPIKSRAYRVGYKQRKVIEEQIEDMLNKGIIRPSTSPWSSPVVLVNKGDGSSIRLCIDFRAVNAKTIKDSYPLPLLPEAIDVIAAKKPKYFTSLDLQSAYNQVAVAESSKPITAFVTHCGLYEYNRMPFGLSNAPATFQRLIGSVMAGYDRDFLICYLDDLILFGDTWENHKKDIEKTLIRLRSSGLKLKGKKCHFAREKVLYLGHLIDSRGVSADPQKCAAVQSFPRPTRVRDIRGYLGLCNWYRKFIPGFCHIAEPLTKLTRKNVPFEWKEEQENAFQELKKKLTQPPILAYPDFDLPFRITTDASNTGVAAVLSQIQDEQERAIAYAGTSLTPPQRNWSTTDRELYGVIFGLKHFDMYVRYSKVEIITDHAALQYLTKQAPKGGKYNRWLMFLQAYDYTIAHRPGRTIGNADALSRREYPDAISSEAEEPPIPFSAAISTHAPASRQNSDSEEEAEDVSEPETATPTTTEGDTLDNSHLIVKGHKVDCNILELIKELKAAHGALGLTPEALRKLQLEDEELRPLFDYLEQKILPNTARECRRLMCRADDFLLQQGCLFHLWAPRGRQPLIDHYRVQLVVPKGLRFDLLGAYHSDSTGHLHISKTLLTVRMKFYWERMSADITNYIDSCAQCARVNKISKYHRAPLGLVTPKGPWDRVAIDIIGPFVESACGKKYILTIICTFTRYAEAIPLATQKATEVAEALFINIWCRWSAPRVLHSDRGQNFLSHIVAELSKFIGSHRTSTSPRHPSGNGLCERYNKTLVQVLSRISADHPKDWPKWVGAALYASRTTVVEALGYSPMFMMTGREPTNPVETALPDYGNPSPSVRQYVRDMFTRVEAARNWARDANVKTQEKMKEAYDKKSIPYPFEVGQKVWLYSPKVLVNSRKLKTNYVGPYVLVRRTSPTNFIVRNMATQVEIKTPIHVNRFKICVERSVRPPDPPLNFLDPAGDELDIPMEAISDDDLLPETEDTPEEEEEEDTATDEQPRDGQEGAADTDSSDSDDPTEDAAANQTDPSEVYYEIQKILRCREYNGKKYYLCQWKNFPKSATSWEIEDNLSPETLEDVQENPVPTRKVRTEPG